MKKVILVLCLYCNFSLLFASQTKTDSIIFCAIETELGRAMKELFLPKLEKPFFISIVVRDVNSFFIQSSLGSIVQDNNRRIRSVSPKVLVGNYNRTQELFSNSSTSTQFTTIEDDCNGIRRSIWLAIDEAYKNAGEGYAKKLSYIKTKNIHEDELALPDFSQEEISIQKNSTSNLSVNLSDWKIRLKEISKLFSKYPNLNQNSVQLQGITQNIYFKNSEGTTYTKSIPVVVLSVNGSIILPSGETIEHSLSWNESVLENLPTLDSIRSAALQLCQKLTSMSDIPKIEESYTGPIIFEGNALNTILVDKLFNRNESLFAYRGNIGQTSPKTWSEKRNRKVITNDLSIYDIPSLKKYESKNLWGYCSIDAEGIVPKDTTLLVENGLLRNFLNDRIPAKEKPESTGNSKFGMNTPIPLVAPSVIEIKTQNGVTYDKLKEQLCVAAKNEGLEYAYIIREFKNGITDNPLLLYRVDIATGVETLYRGATLSNITQSTLKRIQASTLSAEAENIFFRGVPISIIHPTAMLFDEVDIDKDRTTSYPKPPIVLNPAIGESSSIIKNPQRKKK